jgi:hypothetical protein
VPGPVPSFPPTIGTAARIRCALPASWRSAAAWIAGVTLAFAALLLRTAPASAQGTWSQQSTTGTPMSGRSTPALAALGPYVYLFGGVRDDFMAGQNTFHDDLHRFDTRRRHWERLTPAGPLPPPRAFAAAVPVPHRHWMLMFGGAQYTPDFSSFTVYDDLWSYDARRDRWEPRRARNSGPGGRSRPTMWQLGDCIYVFGGIDQSFQPHNDLWVYEIMANRWTLLVPDGAAGSPPPRHEAMAGSNPVLGQLTLYGGETLTADGFATLGDTWQFDLLRRVWTDVTPSPEHNITPPRNYAAVAWLGTQLFLQGGDVPGGVSGCGSPFPQNPTDELWRFDAFSRTWARLQPAGDSLPRLKRSVAVAVGMRMFVFAGFDFSCDGEVGGQVWNEAVHSYVLHGR